MRLSDKTVCVVDKGLFVSWALRLACEFGKVYYHNTSWKQFSPRSNELLVGHGFEEITMAPHFWDIVPEVDLFVFPYIYDGDLQQELVRQGKRVWGSRRGEDLEIYRIESKETFKRLGMPLGDYAIVKGITNLRLYLQQHPNVYVKTNLTRGDGETFHSPSYDEILPRLRKIEHDLNDAAEGMLYLVEKPIKPAVEIGYDGFCIDDQFPPVAINGIEIKDEAYIGALLPYEELDEHVRQVNAWLAPELKKYQYRGLFSTEVRVGPDEQPKLIDVTARSGSPPDASMQEMISNWAEIMWYGAEGVMVTPEMDGNAKYSAQVVIYSEHAAEGWQPINVPDEARRWTKLFFHCQTPAGDRVIPQRDKMNEVGWVVGTGPTVKKAIKACEEHAGLISGYKATIPVKTLQDAVEEIKKGERMGIQFSDERIAA